MELAATPTDHAPPSVNVCERHKPKEHIIIRIPKDKKCVNLIPISPLKNNVSLPYVAHYNSPSIINSNAQSPLLYGITKDSTNVVPVQTYGTQKAGINVNLSPSRGVQMDELIVGQVSPQGIKKDGIHVCSVKPINMTTPSHQNASSSAKYNQELHHGTICFSGPSFNPYKHDVFARELNVHNTGAVSPVKIHNTGQIRAASFKQVCPVRSDLNKDEILMKQRSPTLGQVLAVNPILNDIEDQSRFSYTSLKSSAADNSSPQIRPEELARIMGKMSSPIKMVIPMKTKMKKIKPKPSKDEIAVKKLGAEENIEPKTKVNRNKNSKAQNSVKSSKSSRKCSSSTSLESTDSEGNIKAPENLPSNEKTKIKIAKTGSKTRISKAQKSSSKTALDPKPWQKFTKIIQITTVSEQTKYKICEIPIFFMNGTETALLPDIEDETPAYVLCSSDDSVIAIMVNFIRPDQYLMTFTDDAYKVKRSRSKCTDENRENFVVKKAFFTTYLGSVTTPVAGRHIVIFGQLVDESTMPKTDQPAPDVNTQELADIVSSVQLSWSGNDEEVTAPTTKPKCDNPLFKAMTRMLKSKRKKDNSPGTSETELPKKKAKFELRVVLKESSKPLFKERRNAKVKKKIRHEKFCNEIYRLLDKLDENDCIE